MIKVRVQDAITRSEKRGCAEDFIKLEKQAKKILQDQKYLCALCGKKMSFEKNANEIASLDRIYSSVRPSPQRKMCSYINNCRWVCWSCNHKTRHCHMPNAKFGNLNDCL